VTAAPKFGIQGGLTMVWQRHIEENPTKKTVFRGKDTFHEC
jgi:hypothetical protein